MKISDKIWVIKDDQRDDLAYMTYVEEGTKAFEKRQDTGRNWASGYQRKKKVEETVYENVPMSGFTIDGFSTRYVTSNRHIKIRDPRGFVLETSIENFIETIKTISIKNGEFQGEFVWGNHNTPILIPLYSDLHKSAVHKSQASKISIPLSKIPIGSVVEQLNGERFIFLGKRDVTITMHVTPTKYGWGRSQPETGPVQTKGYFEKGLYALIPLRDGKPIPGDATFKKTPKFVKVEGVVRTPVDAYKYVAPGPLCYLPDSIRQVLYDDARILAKCWNKDFYPSVEYELSY
jgi:hypothetical protein